MKTAIFLSIILFSSSILLAQEKIESDIDFAYQNAKKGIYWALSNIPKRKSKVETDLIADDRLFAHVRLDKETGGVKIASKGHYKSHTVEIIIYRSNDSLIEYGYLKEKKEE